jgi:nucleotide-binding universal stress UspA family protein
MYHVLVPVDRKDDHAAAQVDFVRSLPHAAEDVRVTIMHVFSRLDDPAPPVERDIDGVETAVTMRETLEDAGIEVETTTRVGDVARNILTTIENERPDAVVIAGRKRAVTETLLGSVARKVARETDPPVVVVG